MPFKHEKDTRGNGSRLILPEVRTEAGRKTFAYQGALNFNGLPPSIRHRHYFVLLNVRLKTQVSEKLFSFN